MISNSNQGGESNKQFPGIHSSVTERSSNRDGRDGIAESRPGNISPLWILPLSKLDAPSRDDYNGG